MGNAAMKRYLKGIVKEDEEIYTIQAVVKDVDLEALTVDCAPFLIGGELWDVQLLPRNNDGEIKKGFYLIPKIGSVVNVSMVNKNDGYVTMVSEIDGIVMGGDEYGGLIKIDDLVTKLNNLENLVNDLVTKYNAHTHTIPTLVTACAAGAGSTTPSVAPATSATESTVLTPTVKEDLENPLIKHGNGI